jgi:hypothetical protein
MPEAIAELFITGLDTFLHLFLGWPLYLFLNLSGGRVNWRGGRLSKSIMRITHFIGYNSDLFPPQWTTRVNLSGVGVLAMISALAYWANIRSFEEMAIWYLLPYSITNLWLVLYTWLHHTHHDVPHFGQESFNWLRGALSTVDRPYTPLINHLNHHIGSTHVLHHLNSKIPHYHAEEATLCIRGVLEPLGLYRYDPRGVVEAVMGVTRECEYVGGLDGVQFYQKGGNNGKGELRSRKSKDDSTGGTTTLLSDDSAADVATGKPPKNSNTDTRKTAVKHEILIEDKIYDVTNFIKKHPGGGIIKFMSGADGSEAFRQFHHRSERAKKILKSLPNRAIGESDNFSNSARNRE